MKAADLSTAPDESPYTDNIQREAADHLGMWTFLATEVLLFGGLFACYSVYRLAYPEAFGAGSRLLEFPIGTINTVILLTSSLFMALGDWAIKRGDRRKLGWFLLLTCVFGAAFLGLKGFEYYQKYREHLIPGFGFEYNGPHAPQVQLFIFLYFTMTGLHAAHMLMGLGALTWLGWLNHRGRLTAENHAPVAMVGLYWHFVDCVWVFLYPLLYLIAR
jgi:cytochrome c oxidase subunit 3